MTREEEQKIIEETIKEVMARYNYVPITLASFDIYYETIRLFKHWNERMDLLEEEARK